MDGEQLRLLLLHQVVHHGAHRAAIHRVARADAPARHLLSPRPLDGLLHVGIQHHRLLLQQRRHHAATRHGLHTLQPALLQRRHDRRLQVCCSHPTDTLTLLQQIELHELATLVAHLNHHSPAVLQLTHLGGDLLDADARFQA